MPPAIIAAAIVGTAAVGSAAINKSAASKASKAATGAAADNNALQERIYDQQRADLQPYSQAGVPALGALNHYLQLDRPSSYGSTPVLPAAGAGAISTKTPGGFAGTSPIEMSKGADGVYSATPASNALASYGQPQPDYAAYLQANPDVAARAQQGVAEGAIGPGAQWQTPEEWAAYHYAASGQGEGRQLPMTQPQTYAAAAPGQEAPGEDPYYGVDVSERADATRPEYAAAPDFGGAPAMPDLTGDAFKKAPGYLNGLTEGQRNLNAAAAANGIGQSGDAAREAVKFGTDYANTKYDSWVGQQLSQWNALRDQYNQDRSSALSQFNTDRGVTNQNFDVDTSRSDARYDADRSYLTVRHDARVNDLFRLAGVGASATGATGAAGQNFANATGANNTAAADATGNAAIAGANGVNGAIGNALTAYSAYAGMRNPATVTPRA